jgi:hypothetical protein
MALRKPLTTATGKIQASLIVLAGGVERKFLARNVRIDYTSRKETFGLSLV